MSISGLESHSQPHDSGLWHTQVLLTSPGWSTQYSRAVHGDKARSCQWALVKGFHARYALLLDPHLYGQVSS